MSGRDPAPVMRARAAAEEARAARLSAEAELAALSAEARALARRVGADDDRLRSVLAARDAAEGRVAGARRAEQRLATGLAGALSDWLPADPVADVGGLSASHPIALLPVRLETRFDRGQSELRIRIYPDEIFADGHEPQLTEAERADGAAHWAQVEQDGALKAWQALLGKGHPSPRAAWIVAATAPQTLAPDPRPANWTRAVEARLLPDRWVALAYRDGAEVARAFSRAVVEPLALTVGPDTPTEETVDVSGLCVTLDNRVVWTVDFDRADQAGMAVRLPLSALDLQRGFDRLVVLGVKASLTPEDAARRLSGLLDAHHFTDGLAFVPQGAPTNNTADSPAAYPPPDPKGEASFQVERGQRLDVADGDGRRWTGALGLDSTVVAHVAGADRREQVAARAMNRALLPASLGYFLKQMMAPLLSDATIDAAGRHFVEYVRGRGPLPAFRVGRVPYGLLPVSSLARWQPLRQDDVVERQLPDLLRRLQPRWAARIDAVPRMGRTGDPDGDLLAVLAMDASCRELRVRRVLGESALWNLTQLLGIEWEAWHAINKAVAAQVLLDIGAPPASDPRVVNLNLSDAAPRFGGPFVEEGPLSETDPLRDNYIHWIRTSSVAVLREQKPPFQVPGALLFKLLRHAALSELARVAVGILVVNGMADASDEREAELVKIAPGTEERRTVWEQFARVVPGVTGEKSLAEFLSPDGNGGGGEGVPAAVLGYRDALEALEALPTAELERLCTETLDLASHRLDAWVTSLATRRLEEMRLRAPAGVHLGALGWVEELRPSTDPVITLPDGRSARASSGGYVHAPSMMHAATAAILRNAYLTHATIEGPQPYALDLSSANVRRALFVLDSVRAGQPVGAVLGYQLERGLHEREVELFIDPLRQRFPLVANKAEDSGELAERVAARNVVDGLQLRTAWREGRLPFDQLPGTPLQQQALLAELGRLDESVDGVADLLMAEAVHQVVRGSTSGAAAGLDALARGTRPPEPDVARSPTGGTTLTHRVAIVVGGAPLPPAPGWPAQPTPRAAAEPRLDGWLGALLGDPHAVRCRVRFPDSTDPGAQEETVVTFDQLALRPLDVLALARSVTDAQLAAELDRRVIFAALGDAPAVSPITVVYAAAEDWDRRTVRTVPELLEVAQAAAAVIGGARGLRPQDLVPADSPLADAVKTEGLLADEALSRATAAEDGLAEAREDLDDALQALASPPTGPQLATLRARLRAAAGFGVAAAFPIAGHGVEEGGLPDPLLEQAASTRDEMDQRLAEAARLHPETGAGPLDRLGAAAAIARAVFGREFVLLGGFRSVPEAAGELAQALAYGPELVGPGDAPRRWLQQAARVRAPLARWRKLRLLSEAIAGPGAGLDVAQLPHLDGARWVALPLSSEEDRLSGRLSLVLQRPAAPAADEEWFGLLLDEWPEIIPNASEHTGVAFHYDDAGGEAAQAVLLAVPPTGAADWDFDTLVSVVNETIDLAKIRAVDGELLGTLGQLLPAIFLSANVSDDAVSTRFSAALLAETQILQGGG